MQDQIPQPAPSRSRLRIGIISSAVVIVLAVTMAIVNSSRSVQPVAVDAPVTNPPDASTAGATYRDGTYTADGSYTTPESQETITVTLTLKAGVVSSVDVTGKAKKRESVDYMNAFAGGYKAVVVGKDIGTLQLGRVSGSSLTPMGFNAALAKIRAQAKAS